MKVRVHGPAAGYGPSGLIESWGPDQLVIVDDGDEKAVAHWRAVAEAGRATLVEDAPKAGTPKAEAPRKATSGHTGR